MRYEVLSTRERTGKSYVAMWTDSPLCIDCIEIQEDILDGGHKIQFSGTQEEYEQIKGKLCSKVKVNIQKT